MSQLARIGVAARAFCVATTLGLSLALLDAAALQGTLLLAALAAAASGLELTKVVPQRAIVLVEAVLTALVVGLALPTGVLLLPYLVVPALVAGATLGLFTVLVTVAVEIVSIFVVVLAAGQLSGLATLSEITAPWLLTTVGVGWAAARVRAIRQVGVAPADASYESARRLLGQLRTVARRLSSGLDSVAMGHQLLAEVQRELADTQAAVFVSTEGGVLAPLAYRGQGARESVTTDDDLVGRCWAEMEPAVAVQTSGRSDRRYRTVLPLRVGFRMIGVVVSDAPGAATQQSLEALRPVVDEHALRIDTALVFAEIRSIATMEERHRLAREIHDGIAQEIASLGYVVDDLAASATTEGQRRKLRELRSELTRVVSELRHSIFDLRSELSAGLGSALADYAREVGARSGLTVHLTLDVAPQRLSGEVETELLRVTQEAITNARKHSGADNLWVDCRIHPPHARISIADDGSGLGTPRSDSYGLTIMRERSDRIGAELDIRTRSSSTETEGTVVTVTVSPDQTRLA